jgi:TetR/AcrR family transcriptional regulator
MHAMQKNRLGSRGRPEESRAAILQAAVREFAREGVAGARTDAIARSAGVNKALLYYYFKDKEALYDAVLDQVFSGAREAIRKALSQMLPPRERLKAYVRAHFDYIAANPPYHRIVNAEFRGRESARMTRIAHQYFRPTFSNLAALLKEGAESGDFHPVNPVQFVPSMIAVIVFYFTTAPVMKVLTGVDPLSQEQLAERRAAVIEFISSALFTSHGHSYERGNGRTREKGERL